MTVTVTPSTTPTISKLGRIAILRETELLLSKTPDDTTLSAKEVVDLFGKAMLAGSRVSRGEEKIEEYVKSYKLTSISKHDALIALKGGLLAENEFVEHQRTLQYLIEGSPRVRALLGAKAASKGQKVVVDRSKIRAAVSSVLAGKPEGSTFTWAEVSQNLVDKQGVSSHDLKSWHSSFALQSKNEYERCGFAKNKAALWRENKTESCSPSKKAVSEA